MTLKTHHKIIHLILVGLLLAMLVVAALGTVANSPIASTEPDHFTLFQSAQAEIGPAAVIACEPTGSQGGGGGC